MEPYDDRTGSSVRPSEKATDETVVLDTYRDPLLALLLDVRMEVANMAAYLKDYPRNSVGRDTIILKLKGRLDAWKTRLAKAPWGR